MLAAANKVIRLKKRNIKDIEYYLLPGASRKTTDIVVERDGTIHVRPPLHMSAEQVDDTVYSKRMWIYRTLAEWNSLNSTHVCREWVNGESFLYLGRHYQLTLVDDPVKPLSLKNGRFLLNKALVRSPSATAAKQAFEQLYSQKGLERLQARTQYFAPKVGVDFGSITVKDIGYKWAACKRNGDLSFHWKCMMAPPKVIDYIVVHELCHNHHRNHTTAFWDEVDKVLPDYHERKDWLRDNGASLTL